VKNIGTSQKEKTLQGDWEPFSTDKGYFWASNFWQL